MFSNMLGMGKPIVLNMWAGLCPTWRNEMRRLQDTYEVCGDQVVFLGIDVGGFGGSVPDDDDQMASPG